MLDNSNCRQQQYRRNNRMPYTAQMPAESCVEESRSNKGIDRMPIAMAYVPWQQWRNIYEPCKALKVGTIFQELDLPFMERSCLTR